MKIGQQPEMTPAATQAAQAATPRNGQNTPANGATPVNRNERKAPPTPSVGVTVSDAARALEQAATSEAAEVDMDKVNSVRQAIAQNSYMVNAEAIADKLLANTRETLGRTPS
jgi:negative regulator of flagellin synthesis FlgM